MLEPPTPASEAGPDGLRPADPRPSDPRPDEDLDHRRADESRLVAALHRRDLLALAECWQRTAPAAHAVARRLLGNADDIESLLGSLYAELWGAPPPDLAHGQSLERWVRSRAFTLSAAMLQAGGQGPAAASCALVLPDLPPARRPATDPVERVIADLPRAAALALVRAHDSGIPAAGQPDPGASAALDLALETLARHTVDADVAQPAPAALGPLGDIVLGLGDPGRAAAVQEQALADTALAERLRFLRRGRRRLEGLPPSAELGPRVLLGVVARSHDGAAANETPAASGASLGPPASAPRREAPDWAGRAPDDDVVITVARQAQPASDAPWAPPGPAAAADQDTGPIAVVAPTGDAFGIEFADEDAPLAQREPGPAPRATAPQAMAPEAMAPRIRRGVGMLLIGTALGMLAGAVALVIR